MIDFKIEKNVPMANNKWGKHKSPFKIVLEKMEVGDSILFPKDTSSHESLKQIAYQAKNRGNKKRYAIKKTTEGVRCWRVE